MRGDPVFTENALTIAGADKPRVKVSKRYGQSPLLFHIASSENMRLAVILPGKASSTYVDIPVALTSSSARINATQVSAGVVQPGIND